MYSPAAMELFGQVKDIFDPAGVLNPGVLVRPRPLDADIRVRPAPPAPAGAEPGGRGAARARPSPHDGGDFAAAVHRCTGVGKCVASTAGHEPGHVPVLPGHQGRAGLHPGPGPGPAGDGQRQPWSPAAGARRRSARPWTCACPARPARPSARPAWTWPPTRPRCCTRPTGAGCGPRSHYALGQLPRWARLASRVPRLANAALGGAGPGPGGPAGGGHRARAARCRRSRPSRSASWYRQPARAAGGPPAAGSGTGPRRCCCSSTPSPISSPRRSGRPRCRVLADAGFSVTIPDRPTCCAITWISTGQLDGGPPDPRPHGRRAEPGRARPASRSSGLEPSCTATLRSDAADLLGTPQARDLAGSVKTLSELLAGTPGWTPPRLDGTDGRGPAALPPQRRHGLGRRRGAAARRPAPG